MNASAAASFRTHLNYIRCIVRLLEQANLKAIQIGSPRRHDVEIGRFIKLYKVTERSIRMDIQLAVADAEFAVVIAPWFPVKCYYALYYLESVLIHLVDGSLAGFKKGGHQAVRKRIYSLVELEKLAFHVPALDTVFTLLAIKLMPTIDPGLNTRPNYWQQAQCVESVAKKLMEYKLHEAKNGGNWNLRAKKGREAKRSFIESEKLMLLDFFYWYRIKANYRDLDYVDFESGIDPQDVFDYLNTFYKAFAGYSEMLFAQIRLLNRK